MAYKYSCLLECEEKVRAVGGFLAESHPSMTSDENTLTGSLCYIAHMAGMADQDEHLMSLNAHLFQHYTWSWIGSSLPIYFCCCYILKLAEIILLTEIKSGKLKVKKRIDVSQTQADWL